MKTVLLLIGLSFCIISEAQTVNKPVLCGKADDVHEQLKQVGENVIWLSASPLDKSNYIFYGNSETGTWSLVQIFDGVACLVGFGEANKIKDNL
tara:strand:- start:1111 stop:1392 length:282 start_codon:yes stop_codon:yes gene_type:complete